MTQKQLRDYLFSDHYNAWPVQNATKCTDYQDYVKKSFALDSEVVVAFGSKSGQTVPLLDTILIRIYPSPARPDDFESYYFHKSEVFSYNLRGGISEGKPSDYIICVHHNDYNAHHPDDMVLTIGNRWLPKEKCVVLDRSIYADDPTDEEEPPIYQYQGNVRETLNGEIIDNCDAVFCESDGSFYHEMEANEILDYNTYRDYYVHPDHDNVRWCIDIDQYTLTDDCYYSFLDEEFYYYENNMPKHDHTQTIQDYHCGVEPKFHVMPIDQNKPLSKYTIGFEVEKDCLDDGNEEAGSYIEQQPLFSHWETDSSCGIEGITNVYSLDNLKQFTDHVCDSDYLNLNTNQKCGGHINFAHREKKLQYWHIRPWLGLIFSMWKKRLNNQYASCNKKLNPYRGCDHHYGALVEKGRGLRDARFELRLPNRVKDRACIIRRFKLMQALIECIDHYINEDFVWMNNSYDDKHNGIPNWMMYTDDTDDNKLWTDKIDLLLEKISPQTQARTRFFVDKAQNMIISGYSPENHKRVLAYAYAFQSYIDEEAPSGVVAELTNPYINS